MTDPFNLAKFLEAQEQVYPYALKELRAGRKRTHWMWFVFPQMRGLGRSRASEFYGISGRDEARAYLDHKVLGSRLRECTAAVNMVEGKSVEQIFGEIDAAKFRSSMTLFEQIGEGQGQFARALELYFEGVQDKKTLELLG